MLQICEVNYINISLNYKIETLNISSPLCVHMLVSLFLPNYLHIHEVCALQISLAHGNTKRVIYVNNKVYMYQTQFSLPMIPTFMSYMPLNIVDKAVWGISQICDKALLTTECL